jgi:chromosome segregation ATPase
MNNHPEPLNIDVRQFVESLDSNAREYFEERAGIAEFEAGMSRADAEQFAMELTKAHFKLAPI